MIGSDISHNLIKELSSAIALLTCTGFAVCFSRRWVPRKPKLRLRSAKPSESQRSRSRFRCRNAQRQPAAFDNAAKLALELGHTSEELIFRHYRELVQPDQARRYWNIMPARRPENVVPMAQAS
jgi:hypothetical protein